MRAPRALPLRPGADGDADLADPEQHVPAGWEGKMWQFKQHHSQSPTSAPPRLWVPMATKYLLKKHGICLL